MKNHLLSNWINIIGTVAGFYSIILFMALQQLFTGERGFTFETVVFETIGGSFVYTYGMLVQRLTYFMVYIVSHFFIDYILLQLLKGKENLTKRMNIEVIIFGGLFVGYAIKEDAFNLLILPFVFVISQWFRKKKLA
jgi:hypothetical protein